MKIKLKQLNENQINEQKKFAAKYYDLIQKELSYKDLCNLTNIKYYSECYKKHMELVYNPYIEMPVFN
jgi:uncharacterized lipoprotein YddW (UPF0748 family)